MKSHRPTPQRPALTLTLTIAAVGFVTASMAKAADTAAEPTRAPQNHCGPEAHAHGVDARGDAAMGFSHEKTTHRFRLTREGGAIEVTAKQASDTASLGAIRAHLRHIRRAFAIGDFSLPGEIHDQVPPGVEEMKARKSALRYTFAELPAGAEVRVTTADPMARDAVHRFLRFQIEDHRTGDPVTVEP